MIWGYHYFRKHWYFFKGFWLKYLSDLRKNNKYIWWSWGFFSRFRLFVDHMLFLFVDIRYLEITLRLKQPSVFLAWRLFDWWITMTFLRKPKKTWEVWCLHHVLYNILKVSLSVGSALRKEKNISIQPNRVDYIPPWWFLLMLVGF